MIGLWCLGTDLFQKTLTTSLVVSETTQLNLWLKAWVRLSCTCQLVWLALRKFWSVVCWTCIFGLAVFQSKHTTKPMQHQVSTARQCQSVGCEVRCGCTVQEALDSRRKVGGQLVHGNLVLRLEIWCFSMLMEEYPHMLQQLNPLKHGWWALALFLPQSFKQLGWWMQQMYGDYLSESILHKSG